MKKRTLIATLTGIALSPFLPPPQAIMQYVHPSWEVGSTHKPPTHQGPKKGHDTNSNAQAFLEDLLAPVTDLNRMYDQWESIPVIPFKKRGEDNLFPEYQATLENTRWGSVTITHKDSTHNIGDVSGRFYNSMQSRYEIEILVGTEENGRSYKRRIYIKVEGGNLFRQNVVDCSVTCHRISAEGELVTITNSNIKMSKEGTEMVYTGPNKAALMYPLSAVYTTPIQELARRLHGDAVHASIKDKLKEKG
ncbi:hypothetical protein J4453_02630 [Candidatus Woesearchaeota archaeon]|nr:hypothetical protein [Candidatus Woesearchaeota archaeon]